MNDKSTLILPDVHNTLERSLKIRRRYPKNKAIWLGDYFDDWGDNAQIVRDVAVTLKKELDADEDEFLLGNHDAHYRYPGFQQVQGGGFETGKSHAINEVLKFAEWDKLKLFTICQGWIISHAGVNSEIFAHPVFKKVTVEEIEIQCAKALMCASVRAKHPVWGCGMARGGSQYLGGIIWMDWNEEFAPIPGINQIVGHTPVKTPQIMTGENSENWNLDTKLDARGFRYIGWIHEDGTFTTEKVE